MKAAKKILAAALLVCMLASLLPAGAALADDTEATPAPGASSEPTATPTAEPASEPTEEPASTPTAEPSTEPTEHVHTWVNGVCSGCKDVCWHAQLDDDGKCKACGEEFDAKIGETLYATLQDAINAAPVPNSENGETMDSIAATVITVLGDVPQPVGENNEKLSVVIGEGRSVTLDLNGHTLNCPLEVDAAKLLLTDSNTDKGYKGGIAPAEGGAMTLKNGAKVEINEDITLKGSPAISQTGGGELIIKNGRINGVIEAESGTAAIYGGVFTAGAESISAFLAEGCKTAENEDAATSEVYPAAVISAVEPTATPEPTATQEPEKAAKKRANAKAAALQDDSSELTISSDSALQSALKGSYYSYTLSATGATGSITWALKDGSLPDGLTLSESGVISGTPTTAGTYTFTVTATDSGDTAASAEKEFTLTVNEPAAQVLNGTTVVAEYATAAEAVENAAAGQTVKLIKDVDEDIVINKNVTLEGAGHSANSVTVKSGAEVTAQNLDAKSLTAESGANVTLKGSNDISTVTNNGTMRIESGHYGTLGGSGNYTVTGGTYDSEVPMSYCREALSDGSIKQRCSEYNSKSKVYEIVDFVLEITHASNSAYHMPGSSKTIDFTLNLPYELADTISVEIDDGTQRKAISGRYYTLSEDSNGYAVISLKANALNALSEGKYKFIYNDEVGSDWMYFHISSTVKTGDTSNIGLWVGIAAASALILCAVAVLIIRNRKKKNSGNPGEDIDKR